MNRWRIAVTGAAVAGLLAGVVALASKAAAEPVDHRGHSVARFAAKPQVGEQLGGGQHPGIDHRPCVTLPESSRYPLNQGRAALERFIDTKGWVVARSVEEVIKHYPFCDHPSGWLAISYTPAHPGWAVYKAVLVFNCSTRQQNEDGTWGPRVPCDPSQPSTWDFLVERGAA